MSEAEDAAFLSLVQGFARTGLSRQLQAFLRLALAENSGAALTTTEASPNLLRLLVTLEMALNHGFKSGGSSWFDSKRSPWTFVETMLPKCCPRVSLGAANTLITTINDIKCSPVERIRVFILKTLMEKSLSEYLRFLTSGDLAEWYDHNALVRSEDWTMLLGLLDGLQGLECTFFVKNHGWLLTPQLVDDYLVAVDKSFTDPEVQEALKFGERKGAFNEAASNRSLSNGSDIADPSSSSAKEQLPTHVLQRLTALANQNAYLEEFQKQLVASNHSQQAKQQQALEVAHQEMQKVVHERNQMQSIILELHERIADFEKRDADSRKRLGEWNEAAKQWEADMAETQRELTELQDQLLANGTSVDLLDTDDFVDLSGAAAESSTDAFAVLSLENEDSYGSTPSKQQQQQVASTEVSPYMHIQNEDDMS